LNFFNSSDYGEKIQLWIARLDNKAIGGAWIFYHHDTVVYWHGVKEPSFQQVHGTHLLLTTIIEHASHQGLHWFDFNPSGGYDGVVHFKEGFGPEKRIFYASQRLNPAGRILRKYRGFKLRVLHRCPI
jgi:lipid II:glycine glycyltransferase (peptidoglycan interpeptide bridge formation enzyme)